MGFLSRKFRFSSHWPNENSLSLAHLKFDVTLKPISMWLLAQSEKLLWAGDGIGIRICRAGQVGERAGDGGRGLQSVAGVIEPGVIGRPLQDNIGSGRNDGQLRAERKAEHRATLRRPIKGVAR